MPLPRASEVFSPAYTERNRGKSWFASKIVRSPRSVLNVVYGQRLREPTPTTDQFICWKHPESTANACWFTAAFVSLTGEVFFAAPFNQFSTPAPNPPNPNPHGQISKEGEFHDSLWWFPQKKLASDAVAARVVDCLLLRTMPYDEESPFCYLSYAQPYRMEDAAITWPWLVPEEVQEKRDHFVRLHEEASAHIDEELFGGNDSDSDTDDESGLDHGWKYHPTKEKWSHSSAPSPMNTLTTWYRLVYPQIEFNPSDQFVFWATVRGEGVNQNVSHYFCVLVCPVTGQLFPSPPSGSVKDAQEGAVICALTKMEESLSHAPDTKVWKQTGLEVYNLSQAVDANTARRIRLRQQVAKHPLPNYVLEQDENTTADMIRTVPVDGTNTASDPLKELEHVFQVNYKASVVTKDTFVTFHHPEAHGFYSCVWITPIGGEIFPAALWIRAQNYLEDKGICWFLEKKEAKMAAAACAVDAFTAGSEERIQSWWCHEPPEDPAHRQRRVEGLLRMVPEETSTKILETAEKSKARPAGYVVGLELVRNDSNNENDDLAVAVQHVASAKAAPNKKPKPFQRNPIHLLQRYEFDFQSITGDNFLCWWHFGPNQELVWACALKLNEEVFLAAPFRDDTPAIQDKSTKIWWFKNKQRALRSAAALAFDCYCFRRGDTERERFFVGPDNENVAYGEERAIHLEDLPSKGLGLNYRNRFEQRVSFDEL